MLLFALPSAKTTTGRWSWIKWKSRKMRCFFSGEDSLSRGPHKRSTTASSESAYGHRYHSQMWTVRSESAFITYAAVCKYRPNLLLLPDFCAAGEILENLLTLKIKLYQRWPRNVAFGSQQLWISDSCTVFSAWYLLAVLFFFPLKVCSPNDSYEVAAETMTDPPPSLTPGSKNTVGRAGWVGFSCCFFTFCLFSGFDQTQADPDLFIF